MNRLEKVHEVVRGKLVSASERQKRHYDLSCTFPRFKVGDGVLLQDTRKYKGLSKKFQFRWIGPFTVTHVISDLLYKIQEKPKTKPKVIHVNRLKPYQGNIRRWYQPPGEPALNTRGRCLNNPLPTLDLLFLCLPLPGMIIWHMTHDCSSLVLLQVIWNTHSLQPYSSPSISVVKTSRLVTSAVFYQLATVL